MAEKSVGSQGKFKDEVTGVGKTGGGKKSSAAESLIISGSNGTG